MDMKIIVDSRENQWQHVQEYFDKNKISYEVRKLDTGDYTFELDNYPHLNLDNKFIVERKGSIDELAGNFSKGRTRFQNEFERIQPDQKMHLVLENFTWRKVLNASYRSKFHPNSYKASLITWCIRYNVPYHLVTKQDSGEIIYEILKQELQNYLNGMGR